MGTSGSAKRERLIAPFLHYSMYVNTEWFYMTLKMTGKVPLNQDTFFGYTQQRYRNITSARDDDSMFLTVNANGQQKEVMLVSEPTTQVASDIQANRLFAIEQFLLAYHPVSAVFYAPNPDSEDGQ